MKGKFARIYTYKPKPCATANNNNYNARHLERVSHSNVYPLTHAMLFIYLALLHTRTQSMLSPRSQHHNAVEACAATNLRMMLRKLRFEMSTLLSSVAPVSGEVSLVRSHSVMASRS